MSPLRIAQRTLGAVVIVEITGRLLYDDEGERELRAQISALVGAGERNILVDLSAVDHMDSGSVGTLVAVHLHTLKRGGRLKILNPSERVRRVLQMTRLESVFEVFDSEADAVGSFGAPLT